MPNETEDYNNFVRANLPAGMSYSANRYRYNNHSFYVFELAAWYYYYLLRTTGTPTEQYLRTLYTTNISKLTPHNQSVMPVPPVVVVAGAGSGSAPPIPYTSLTKRVSYLSGSSEIKYIGGKPKAFSTDFAQFPVTTTVSGGNIGGVENAIYWRAGITTNAATVAVAILGGSASIGYRFIVDGQYVSLSQTIASTGGRQYIILSFGVSATRTIYVEANSARAFVAFNVDPSDVITAPSDEPTIALFLGDSFSTGTGALSQDGYYTVMAEQLGFSNIWASGSGGTGYLATSSGTGYKLSNRVVADIARASSVGTVSKVFVAMGLNDLSLGDVTAEANICFDLIRSALPDASVSVFSPWDVNAPAAPAANFATRKAEIKAAVSGRIGFKFIDLEGVSFTKADGTHPNTEGHATLGNYLLVAERAALA